MAALVAGQLVVVDWRDGLPKQPDKRRPAVVVEDHELFDTALAFSVWDICDYWGTGKPPQPLGTSNKMTAPYQAMARLPGRSPVSIHGNSAAPFGPTSLTRTGSAQVFP